ncbi:MAG TPA: polysaccharide pyruvyl transferase family protein, partial [Kiritimatiellia bacterium]|nr:polysaccharide pyruvyl transferase family protein [Kiritimatiellia bacterium]
CMPGVLDGDPGEVVFGIGTILCSGMPVPAATRCIHVLGSGCGYGDRAPDPRYRVWFVRGPRTAARLGVEDSKAISDPAMLLPRLMSAAGPAKARAPVFIPHIDSALVCDWATPCALAGVRLVDPRTPAEAFIDAVRAAPLVLAESLHGAVVADAFGVPWVPLASSDDILAFKWEDWLDTLALEYRPCRVQRRIPWGWTRLRGGLRRLADDLGLSRRAARTRVSSLLERQPRAENCADSLLNASRQTPFLSQEEVRSRIAERLAEAITAFARFAGKPAVKDRSV